MRSKSIAVALAIAASLAVPVGASAHPFTTTGGAFSGELPTIDFESGGLIAGRSDFEGGTPPGDYTTSNMRFLGYAPRPANLATANSDIAFQGNLAYQGTFRGFHVVDIRKPAALQTVNNYEQCRGSQGDVIVYKDILARSWDAPAGNNATCDGQPVPPGWEGLHIFDISDPTNPELLAQVRTRCGSHTASAVPDQRNQRLLIYNTPSYSAGPPPNCATPAAGIQVVEVPLGSPEDSRALQFEEAGPTIRCHDTGVYLGTKTRRAACAGGNGIAVWSMDAEDGGSLEDPALLYARDLFVTETSDFRVGHSAAFSHDGETLIIGHEPGGGVRARCQQTGAPLDGSDGYTIQTNEMKSFFFLATDTGATQAKWTLPRPQTATENCTLHNYNIVPTKKRDVLVQGSYQSGIGVLDFSDLKNIREVGFADPKPLNPNSLVIGGDWSSHWYNGFVYQSDITRGLLSWQYLGDEFRAATHLNRLNPQTQVVTDG